MKYWAVVYLVKLERYKYTRSLHRLPSHLLWHLCHLLYRLLSDISICFHRPTSTNTNKSFETIWAVCSSATLLACVLYATGDWELYAIIINSELSHPPYTDTQMLKEGEISISVGETPFLTVAQFTIYVYFFWCLKYLNLRFISTLAQ